MKAPGPPAVRLKTLLEALHSKPLVHLHRMGGRGEGSLEPGQTSSQDCGILPHSLIRLRVINDSAPKPRRQRASVNNTSTAGEPARLGGVGLYERVIVADVT